MLDSYIPESELVLNEDGSVYHLHLKPEHIASDVILVGDPGRVEQVAGFFDFIEFRVRNREFVTVTGSYKGHKFTVLSTGIGTDNIDIVVNELDAAVNIDLANRKLLKEHRSLNLVRIGTSGGIHEEITVDSFVLSKYGLGFDGLIYYYDYQQSEDELSINNYLNKHLNWNSDLSKPYLVAASDQLVARLGLNMTAGITATATGFYGPQGRKLRLNLNNERMHEMLKSFNYRGLKIINFEMETSGLYGLGKMLGHNCCTCCAIIANRVTKQYSKDSKKVINRLIEQVLEKLAGTS